MQAIDNTVLLVSVVLFMYAVFLWHVGTQALATNNSRESVTWPTQTAEMPDEDVDREA